MHSGKQSKSDFPFVTLQHNADYQVSSWQWIRQCLKTCVPRPKPMLLIATGTHPDTHELGLRRRMETRTGLGLLVMGCAESGRQHNLRSIACFIYRVSPRGHGHNRATLMPSQPGFVEKRERERLPLVQQKAGSPMQKAKQNPRYFH